ncbi:hypothetical protein F4779DRAFT_563514 [Xylariaceae sp. FL0662B]|nr:hypothetical protein F4779DRAFT_563514 [Xylariaceae sp. FL0662B]
MSTNELGPLVRLWGLRTEQLPSPTESADELAPFLISILQEAVPFIDSAAPKSPLASAAAASPTKKLWKSKATKSSPDSSAKVEVLERVVSAADLELVAARNSANLAASPTGKDKKKNKVGAETWCCRRSVHEDAEKPGTASWDEFDACFRARHAETEKAFTPACVGAHEALRWDCGAVEAAEGGETWDRFSLAVEEMRHQIGRPLLRDRTFPVLQMSCAARGAREFLVVSIPVPDFAKADASRLAREKGAQVAFYVSVERIRKMPDGNIEWLMATASDAAGVLPMWVQTLAMPGVIWKDVPLFLTWIAKERRSKRVSSRDAGDRGVSGPDGGSKREGGASFDIPQASNGVETANVPKASDGTNDADVVSATAPQASTGIEAGKTTEVSGHSGAGADLVITDDDTKA